MTCIRYEIYIKPIEENIAKNIHFVYLEFCVVFYNKYKI